MSLLHLGLGFPGYVPSTAGVIAECSTNKLVVKRIQFFNTNTTVETVKVYVVEHSGGGDGTPSAANQVDQFTIAPSCGCTWEIGPILLPSAHDAIFASTTTSSKVTYQLIGDEDDE